MEHSPRFLNLVNESKSRIDEKTADELIKRTNHDENILLIDIREESEWLADRIKGAAYLGRGILERDIEKLEPDIEREIILYCGGGYRSALAADNLSRMGYKKVYSLAGGIGEWREKNYPIDSSPVIIPPKQS